MLRRHGVATSTLLLLLFAMIVAFDVWCGARKLSRFVGAIDELQSGS